MSQEKQGVRTRFRRRVFMRDSYTCRCCGKYDPSGMNLDPHHITPRELMPGGGYVPENGITLCKGLPGPDGGCHLKAERCVIGFSQFELYEKIGSSFQQAWAAAEKETE